MYGLRNKFSEKLSGLFGEATNSSSSSSEARRYSKENKSLSSYFSNIIPSVSVEGFRSDKHQYEHKSSSSLPSTYRNGKIDSFDRYEGYGLISNAKNGLSKDLEDENQASGRSSGSSEVFEEAMEQYSSDDPLSNLSDDSSFISSDLYEFLEACLPNIVKGCKWVLLYSTLKHGISLRTLIRNSAELSGPCLLIVGDKQGAVFGGLLESPLKPTPKRKYQGSNQTFVFTTLYGPPRLFRPTGANRYYYLCLSDLLALGGGGSFALCLDGDLLNGSSGPCDTFGNLCLAHSPEFELKNVELWGFAHASRYRAG